MKQALRYNANQLISTFPQEQKREILPRICKKKKKKKKRFVEIFNINWDRAFQTLHAAIASCCKQLRGLPALLLRWESKWTKKSAG